MEEKSTLDFVEEYIKKDFRVFPLKPHTKSYYKGFGYTHATNDSVRLANFYPNNTTNTNVGLYLLDKEIIVLDIDRHGENNGFLSLFNLEQDYEELPETYTVSTPRDGEHRYFRTTGLLMKQNMQAFKEGIDIITSHIYAPPTYVKGEYNGVYIDGSYSVKNGSLDELAELPQWFIQLIVQEHKDRKEKKSNSQPVNGSVPPQGKTWKGIFLDEMVEGAGEGNRNDWLTSFFGKLVYSKMNIQNAIQLMEVVNQNFVSPPIDQIELERIMTSILKRQIAGKGGNR